MATYKCFECQKEVAGNLVSRKIRCPYCGSKVLIKPQVVITKPIKAR